MGWNDAEAGKFSNLVSFTPSQVILLLYQVCLTYLVVGETSWESNDKWNSATEAGNNGWDDGGFAGDAPAPGANEGGDGRTCRL